MIQPLSNLEIYQILILHCNQLKMLKIYNLQLTKQRIGVTTQIANKIYVDLPQFGKEYKQLITNHFESAIDRVDFATNSEKIRQNINEWVQKQTNQKIKNFLGPGAIQNQTKMILVNAIYFKGEWLKKFEVSRTKKRDFYLEKKQTIKIDTMFREGVYDFFDNGQYQYASIPYKGDEYVMEIILPNEQFTKFESTFNHQTFQFAREKKINTKIKLYLPKFKFEPQNSTSFKQILLELGIDKVFSSDANFSFMDPLNSISVEDVIHKAMIEVNEKGAEAVAVTSVLMNTGCCARQFNAPIIPIMDCNKPFIYSITHQLTNTSMFLGKVFNPSQN